MKTKRSRGLAILETQGLSNITDGREFVVTGPPEGYGQPTDDNEIFLQPKENCYPKEIRPVNEDSPFSCEYCGELFQRSTVGHTIAWMYTVFYCPSHPYEVVLLDVFPKVSMDTTHDWGNAFMGLDTRSVGELELEARSIHDSRPANEWVEEQKAHINKRYIITPEAVRKEGFRRWAKSRLSKFVKVKDK